MDEICTMGLYTVIPKLAMIVAGHHDSLGGMHIGIPKGRKGLTSCLQGWGILRMTMTLPLFGCSANAHSKALDSSSRGMLWLSW